MFYTNGAIISHDQNDIEQLLEVKSKLERWLEMEKGIVTEMQLDETLSFPAYTLPSDLTINDLYHILPGDISLRAINQDVFVHPTTTTINVKVLLDEEEMLKRGAVQTEKIIDRAKLQREKAIFVKRISAKIAELDKEISDEAEIMAQGYEYRDEECFETHNFIEKKIYYISTRQEGVMMKSKDMEKKDFQLQIFAKPATGDWSKDIEKVVVEKKDKKSKSDKKKKEALKSEKQVDELGAVPNDEQEAEQEVEIEEIDDSSFEDDSEDESVWP